MRLKTVRTPVPGRRQVRVRLKACGVCHTDLHIAEGDLPLKRKPVICGHEAVGVVDLLGAGVESLRPGDRVGTPWLHTTCGRCPDCLARRGNLCLDARFTGYHINGGFAEYMVVAEEAAYKLPAGYSDVEAAPLLCAGVIGYRALKLAGAVGARKPFRLGLYGFGASAHLTLQLARNAGCSVYVFSRTADHRRLAKRLGAAWSKTADDRPPRPLDGGIIFAPAGALVPKALSHLRRGGTLALAGVTMTPIPEMDYSLIYGERRLTSVANSTPQDVRDMLKAAGRKRLHVEVERYAFEDAVKAMVRMEEGRVQGAAVLVMDPS